jgi:hypothetical protein
MPTASILGVSGINYASVVENCAPPLGVENVWSFACTPVCLLGHRDNFIFVYELT